MKINWLKSHFFFRSFYKWVALMVFLLLAKCLRLFRFRIPITFLLWLQIDNYLHLHITNGQMCLKLPVLFQIAYKLSFSLVWSLAMIKRKTYEMYIINWSHEFIVKIFLCKQSKAKNLLYTKMLEEKWLRFNVVWMVKVKTQSELNS